ncbi:hypothetical protein ASF73_20440 [Xanthomonas sp. Leaf131]|nr:hypothetical protein ASF73_20440 [Xanthomonas sp. Leaf131]
MKNAEVYGEAGEAPGRTDRNADRDVAQRASIHFKRALQNTFAEAASFAEATFVTQALQSNRCQ